MKYEIQKSALAGFGVLATLVGSIAPAAAQGHRLRHEGQFGRPRLAANASWSEIDKTPRFNTDSRPGFYVWREGDELFVVANARNRNSGDARSSGEVTIQGGGLSNPQGYRNERDDRFQQVANNRLTFRFNTGDGLDGIKFHVDGGKRIVIRLNGDGAHQDHVYLGKNKLESGLDPLVIEK